MKLFGVLYGWMASSKSDFTRNFRDNEILLSQANKFWTNIESSSMIILLISIVVGIMMAWSYYGPYNNKPGRHYRPRYWFIFMLLVIVLTLILTLGFECLAYPPQLQGAFVLELKIALINAIYAIGVYLLASFIWCNTLPTNACRILKI